MTRILTTLLVAFSATAIWAAQPAIGPETWFTQQLKLQTNAANWRQALGVGLTRTADNFGATGNGTTDDTSALQQAFNACAAVGPGATLIVPPTAAYYKITSTLTITNGFTLSGYGARLRAIGYCTNVIVLSNFNGGTIEGATFETDQSGLAFPMCSVFAQNDNLNNVRFLDNVVKGMRTIFRNGVVTNATCTNLWVARNTFTGDLTGVSGIDNGNVLEVRGFNGFHITQNNWLTQGEMEMIKISDSSHDSMIDGNLFYSVGLPTPGGPVIDTFTCKTLRFLNNTFHTRGYEDVIVAKPSTFGLGSAFSEEDELQVLGNLFDYQHTNVFGSPISFYGSWGLSDQTLSNSLVSIQNNQFKINAPNDTYANIYTRGFTHVEVTGNSIARVERTANTTAIDASNSKDIVIAHNNVEGGAVLIADNQSNPPGSTYTNCPQTITFVGNVVREVPSFACLWLTGLTNQGGLKSLLVSGNSLYPQYTAPGGTNSAILRIDGSIIQDAVVTDNAGSSDFGTYYKVNGTTVNGNEVYNDNTWQQNQPIQYVPINNLTNVTVDFKVGSLQYVQANTNDLYFTVTNATAGARTTIRVHSPQQNLITFDPQIATVGPIITYIPQFATLMLDFIATAAGNTNASVVVFAHLYPDQEIEYPTYVHFQGGVVSEANVQGSTFGNASQTFAVNSAGLISASGLLAPGVLVTNIAGGALSLNRITSNEGAGSEVLLAWPTNSVVGDWSTLFVRNAVGMRLIAPSNMLIRYAGSVSTNGGFIESTTLGDVVKVRKNNSSELYVESHEGAGWAVH